MVLLASDSSDDSILNGAGEDGSFVFELPSGFSGKKLTLGAFYPASAAVAGDNGNPEDYRVTLPAEQNPGEWSWDPAAELFAAARGSLTLDDFTKRFSFDLSSTALERTHSFTVSGTGERLDDILIIRFTASGSMDYLGRSYVVSGSEINCVARLNDR